MNGFKTLIVLLIAMTPVQAAEVARARVTHSPKSIQQIIQDLSVGAAIGNVDQLNRQTVNKLLRREASALSVDHVSFWVDGSPIRFASPRLWLTAVGIQQHRTQSNVQYAYTLRIGGVTAHRHTHAQVGYVRLTTTITGDIGQLCQAVSTITAVEQGGRTTVTNSLWVQVPLCYRSRLVTRIASRVATNRVIPPLIDCALARAEAKALAVSARGQATSLNDLAGAVVEQVRGGLR